MKKGSLRRLRPLKKKSLPHIHPRVCSDGLGCLYSGSLPSEALSYAAEPVPTIAAYDSIGAIMALQSIKRRRQECCHGSCAHEARSRLCCPRPNIDTGTGPAI